MGKPLTIFIQKSVTSVMNGQKGDQLLSQIQALNKLRDYNQVFGRRGKSSRRAFPNYNPRLCVQD